MIEQRDSNRYAKAKPEVVREFFQFTVHWQKNIDKGFDFLIQFFLSRGYFEEEKGWEPLI